MRNASVKKHPGGWVPCYLHSINDEAKTVKLKQLDGRDYKDFKIHQTPFGSKERPLIGQIRDIYQKGINQLVFVKFGPLDPWGSANRQFIVEEVRLE